MWGDHISDDGTALYRPDDRAELEYTNCGQWQQDVSCPVGSKATGVLIHHDMYTGVFGNSTPVATITGLQLICRDIGLR